MEKQVRRFKVDFDFNWTGGVEIKKLKEDLETLEKLGVTEIEIDAENNWEFPYVTIKAFIDRIETDEECNARVAKENQRQEDIKRRELEQFEKLKSKYGM